MIGFPLAFDPIAAIRTEFRQMPTSEQVYRQLVEAFRRGELLEPFTKADFKRACPGLTEGTCRSFLWRHSGGDPTRAHSPLLERVEPAGFRLCRPFKFGL